MTRRRIFCVAGLLGLLVLTACGPSEPTARRVSARTPIAFSIWRSDVGSALTPEQWQEFDTAIQEMKYRITAETVATGTEAVDEALRERIDGQTVHRVFLLGARARLDRLRSDREQLEHLMEVNALVRTRPDDEASIAYLRNIHDRQTGELADLKEKIASQEAKVRQLEAEEAPRS